MKKQKMSKDLVYFISLKPTTHRTPEENLGIGYLSSCAELLGVSVNIYDSWIDENINEQSIFEDIEQNKDRLLYIGFSCYMMNNIPTLELAKKIKGAFPNLPIIVGGYGPSFETDFFCNEFFDIAVIGEGENTIQEITSFYLTQDRKIDSIDGIMYFNKATKEKIFTNKRLFIENLDEVPFPKRPYLKSIKQRKSTINVITSRGCMAACFFCSISSYLKKHEGKRWRSRSVESIIEELKQLQSLGVEMVKFVDDSFIELERDWKWCKEFYKQIKKNKIKIKFRASIRSIKAERKVLKYLRKAGFFSFSCGIENISNQALKRMSKVASKKINIKCVKNFKRYKYFVQAGYILFDINTSINELYENYAFLKKNKHLITKGIFSEMFAAVGTVYTQQLKKDGANKFSSNYLYDVKDEKARLVYKALKKWQFEFSTVYDKIIDPISAPKNISYKSMKKYQKLMIKLKKIDLLFMKEVLKAVEQGQVEEQINVLYESFISKYKSDYEKADEKANKLYSKDGFDYDGNVNGFLKSNIQ